MSPRDAIRIVARSRHQHGLLDQEDEEGGFRWLTELVVSVAALVQAIKLFAFRGIPLTQVLRILRRLLCGS